MTNNVNHVKEKMNFSDKLHFRRKKNDEEATVGSNASPASSVERDREVVSPVNGGSRRVEEHEEEEEDEEVPQMNVITTIVSAFTLMTQDEVDMADPDGDHYRVGRCDGRVLGGQYQRIGRGSPESF